jgi:hypothetical protein
MSARNNESQLSEKKSIGVKKESGYRNGQPGSVEENEAKKYR